MMHPECRIECSIVKISHVSSTSAHHVMNAVMNILKRCLITFLFVDNLVVGEGKKIFIDGIREKDVDILLEAFINRFHCLKDIDLLEA